jgi:hypothetical protein
MRRPTFRVFLATLAIAVGTPLLAPPEAEACVYCVMWTCPDQEQSGASHCTIECDTVGM